VGCGADCAATCSADCATSCAVNCSTDCRNNCYDSCMSGCLNGCAHTSRYETDPAGRQTPVNNQANRGNGNSIAKRAPQKQPEGTAS
jgi:hypothetical protein